jgi:hypothetical protein
VEAGLFRAADPGDVERTRAFFGPDGRLKAAASKTGSTRLAPDGGRLPCPSGSTPEIGPTPSPSPVAAATGGGSHALRSRARLLLLKADPARRNADGKTALDLARERPDHAGCGAGADWLAGSALEPRRP